MVNTADHNRGTSKETVKIPKKAAKKRPIIQVVACPSAFPISRRQNEYRPPPENKKEEPLQRPSSSSELLDWNETVKEVRRLGSKAFTGQLKRQHEDEEYKKLTGRHKKKHQVPLPIVRGIKKKAAEREAKYLEECKHAGIVLPKQQTKTQTRKSTKQPKNPNAIYGPAPSIGFIKQGILRVKDHSK
jgi:hypothetical protein